MILSSMRKTPNGGGRSVISTDTCVEKTVLKVWSPDPRVPPGTSKRSTRSQDSPRVTHHNNTLQQSKCRSRNHTLSTFFIMLLIFDKPLNFSTSDSLKFNIMCLSVFFFPPLNSIWYSTGPFKSETFHLHFPKVTHHTQILPGMSPLRSTDAPNFRSQPQL